MSRWLSNWLPICSFWRLAAAARDFVRSVFWAKPWPLRPEYWARCCKRRARADARAYVGLYLPRPAPEAQQAQRTQQHLIDQWRCEHQGQPGRPRWDFPSKGSFVNNLNFLLAGLGALPRCESLVWRATPRSSRLASHPNPTAKSPSYFLTSPKCLAHTITWPGRRRHQVPPTECSFGCRRDSLSSAFVHKSPG